jgi:uncharacterized protein with ParB-like and HNH nuclease domain
MKYECISIKKAVQMIDEKRLLLPHIQRPFVWKQDRTNNQVKRFFDSILRGYPFGTLLFWITRDDIQVRRFIDDYKDGMDVKETYLKSSEYKDKEKTLVLDGQQRLQALYIALKGTYNGKELYFDILSGGNVFWNKGDELRYNFEYFTRDNAKKKSNDENYWVLLKNIVLSDENTVKLKRDVLKQMKDDSIVISETIEERVEENVANVKNMFTALDLIYYYPIDSTLGKFTEYEEILEIFIRTNSGGTPLCKSDLMFSLIKLSWDESEEEFEDLLNTMNRQGAFYFDKDFILKTSLVLLDKRAKYAVEKFKGSDGEKTLETIKDKWQKIVESFNWVKDFLDYARVTSGTVLPSYNALIPIIYFAYIHDCKPNSPKVKYNIQTWLYKALLNGNFGGQSDRVIDNCTDIIKKYSEADYFPYSELEDNTKTKLNRVVDVNPNIIDGNTHLILNLLYLFNNQIINFQPKLNGNSPEIDHIFPKSKMVRTYNYPSGIVNNIGNYMFLEKILNILKGSKLPEEYFPDALNEQSEFYGRNFIPDDPQLHKPEKFEEFVNRRRDMIFTAIKEVLKYRE